VATNAKRTAILCFRSLQWRCITTIRVMRLRQSKHQCIIDIVAGIHNHDLRDRVHASLYLIHSCALNCTGSQGLLKGGPSFFCKWYCT
jgi:hypothetical protein